MNENTMTTDDKSGAVQDAGELSVEAVRHLIEREYGETLPPNAPELLDSAREKKRLSDGINAKRYRCTLCNAITEKGGELPRLFL